jgi:hypothetical protein
MLLFSPVSMSLCLHLLEILIFCYTSTCPSQPSFTVSVMHLCSFLLLRCFSSRLPSSTRITQSKKNAANLFSVLYFYSLFAPCACYMCYPTTYTSLRSSSLALILRSFGFTDCNSLRTFFHLSVDSMMSLHSTGCCLETLHLLRRSP